MKVLGIDVSKSSITTCLLDSKPPNVKKAYNRLNFQTFNADTSDIKKLLDLSPNIAVLEPTGLNYSRLWISVLTDIGCEVCLVDHASLAAYRKSLGFSDKDDDLDSLVLACYWFDRKDSPERFLLIRDTAMAELRDLCYRLQFAARLRNPLINRIKQDLAWQFPEKAKYTVKRSFLGKIPLLWRWLAGLSDWAKYDKQYKESKGLGLLNHTKKLSSILCGIYDLEQDIEEEIRLILQQEAFTPYLEVFAEFGFGEKCQAILLSQIYPIEKFLKNGEPEIEKSPGKVSGKITKKNLSKRRFKKYLGCVPNRSFSGDSKKYFKTGPSFIRTALHLWILTTLAPAKSLPDTEVCKKLRQILDEGKDAGTPTLLLWAKVRAKAMEMLFDRLVKKLARQQKATDIGSLS